MKLLTAAVVFGLVQSSIEPASAKSRKPPPPLAQYANSMTMRVGCSQVWPFVIPTILAKGLAPENSDRAGGVMRLRYTKGEDGSLGANKDVRTLTTHRMVMLEIFDRFRIDGGTLSLQDSEGACMVMMQMEYSGLKTGGFSPGWGSLPSNGYFENLTLGELQKQVQ